MYDVVIPARNEAQTIIPIVNTFMAHPIIRRVIVAVDSDTTDNTADMARNPFPDPIVLNHAGRGKGQCVATGLEHVKTDQVVFSDADYRGLCLAHIDRLIFGRPKAFYTGDMVIGVPDFPRLTDIPAEFRGKIEWAWPWMSGIRVMQTDIAKSVELTGYLMETQLNNANHKAGKDVMFVRLPGLVSPLNLDEKRLDEMERDRLIGVEKGLLPP